jgi:hypothetical protein
MMNFSEVPRKKNCSDLLKNIESRWVTVLGEEDFGGIFLQFLQYQNKT